ncbi:MAG: ATP-binding cassette domain-containing protein [Alkalibacterium sp.]|nr:ATP-binding cassette domain-containing protein [Alkalibacterium sp.]
MEKVSLQNVTKQFKNELILDDVNLTIQSGETVGIVGSNGSGKTTLLRLIAGLSYADKGTIVTNDKILTPGELPSEVGILIETPQFFKSLTGYDNLKYLSRIKNVLSDEDIKQTLTLVGLDPTSKKKVSTYSLGMRQRLGIAQAIMEKPTLILFDEPTNALDEEGAATLKSIIVNLKKCGTSFLFVSHSRVEIAELCDRVFKISSKQLVEIND